MNATEQKHYDAIKYSKAGNIPLMGLSLEFQSAAQACAKITEQEKLKAKIEEMDDIISSFSGMVINWAITRKKLYEIELKELQG